MSFTDREKELVTNSFTKVAPIAEQAAELFYGRLFEVAPEVKPMFGETDMKQQGRKLMQTIATAVGALNRLDTIMPEIEALGKRHVAYGVTKEQYNIVGETLIWTLTAGLGDAFDDETKQAWIKVYTALAGAATKAYEEH